ncbi:MAG TPA: endonuclease domain-containing protein [Xanthobacteraceae bacterium]|nr:endonuclease domain-containing protein [Xanthobacteraceae bacterium]
MRRTIDSFRRETARRLRANATNAEENLWRYLRRSPVLGTHFRRQVPIGPYVADFACMAARLIIEIDGSQHAEGPVAETDKERTRWLESEGYRVIRFWNNDITQNMTGVLEAIHIAISATLVFDEPLKHERRNRNDSGDAVHPTPARSARRPSPSRGG